MDRACLGVRSIYYFKENVMKTIIDKISVIIWETLVASGNISFYQRSQIPKEKPLIVYQELDRLAREAKIAYHIERNKMFAILSDN